MEINQLRYFLAACEKGNFSRAAACCFTSRQNLTKSIHNLERELGVRLFAVAGNAPVLTADGERAALLAERVVGAADEMARAFDAGDSFARARPLRLACGLSMQHSADALYRALVGFDSFELSVSENAADRCYRQVVRGKADVALIYCMNRRFDDCESLVLGTAPVQVLVDAKGKLAACPSVRLHQLEGYLLVLLPGFEFVYEPFLDAYRASGLDADHICSIASFGSMKEWITSHKAVSLVSSLYPDEIPEGLRRVPLSDVGCEWRAVLLYRRDSPRSRQISELLEYFEAVAKEGGYV